MAENLGQGVLEKFTAINEVYKAVAAEAEADETEYNDYCASCDKDLAKKLEELSVKIAKMEEHMQYAAEHTRDVEVAQIPMDIEREELDDLHRHIDPNSQNDVNADTLYTKASGKKLYYEEEVERTKKKISGSKVQAKRLLDTQLADLSTRRDKAGEEFRAYINSEEFKGYLTSLSHDAAAFNSSGTVSDLGDNPAVSLGQRRLRLPIPAEFEQELSLSTGGIFNSAAKTIGAPYSIDVALGKVIYVDYDQRNENYMLGGVQRFLVNVLKYYENSVQGIFYADPVRWNTDGLGHIAGLAKGNNSIIEPVAENMEQLIENLNSFRENLSEEDKPLSRLFVFHSFPESYPDEARAVVLDIVRNAEKYKTVVVLTHNSAAESTNDCVAAENTVRAKAEIIRTMNGGFYVETTRESLFWYSAPSDLPEEIRRVFIEQRRRAAAEAAAPDSSAPAGTSQPAAVSAPETAPAEVQAAEKVPSETSSPVLAVTYKKGEPADRFCFGSDTAGNKMYYSLSENGSTAFVCGTKRAGRTDILHSIIDGIISGTHPDDTELWLIDFEGNEFSCYAEPVAPQIRYLVLGGTDELAYSVIDRLCEVIRKRAALFKGKWGSFSEVSGDVYMPEIVCVVEGFDAMAQAIAAKEAVYGAKLRTVLLNAKKYGLRVILAGDRFTVNGNTRSYFTGNVFDFRVAMNSEDTRVAEIFNGLDLTTEDLMSVYSTPDRFAFVNLPAGSNAKIKLSSVDERKPAENIRKIAEGALSSLTRSVKYDPQDNSAYVFKKCSVKSITARTTFDSVMASIEDDISRKPMGVAKLFVGTTGTLTSDHSVDLENIFGSNIYLESPYICHANAADAVISAARSALMQECAVEILATEDSDILKDIRTCESMEGAVIKTDFVDICRTITSIKEDIIANKSSDKLYILLGGEILLAEMESMGAQELSDGRRNAAADLVFAVSQGAKLGIHFLIQVNEEKTSEAFRLCTGALRHRITISEDGAQYSYGMVTEAFTPYSNLTETEETITESYLL